MAERSRTGGDLVVETLTALGATHVFGIPGQHALALFDALRRSTLTFVSSRVENNSVFQADGYARTTGRVGVVFLSTGPGALMALAALQEAYAACVPLVVITSQVPRRGLGGRRNGLLHQLDDQQVSARNVTKSTALVRAAADVPVAVGDAWRLARAAPAGPTWVEVPEDVLREAVDLPDLTWLDGTAPRPPEPAPEVVQAAGDLLAHATRPVVLAGGGVRRSDGGPAALVRVAELLDAPVVSTVGGKGSISFAHPLSAGSWIEDRYTTSLLEDADVLLAVGTSLGEITSNYFTLAPRGRIVQIDAEPRVLGANHEVLGVPADAATALRALGDDLADRLQGTSRRPCRGAAAAADLREAVEKRLSSQPRAVEQRLLQDLRDALADDVDSFWDMTVAGYWAWSAWDSRTGGFHSAQASGGLGFAFPAAMGAALGSGRRTVAVTGDGGAMYSIAELASARQHAAPVTWLIIDDGGYGILREYMVEAFGAATATELTGPDFGALAESFGVVAMAATPDTVGTVVASTFSRTGPAVVVLRAALRMFAPTHLSPPSDEPRGIPT